MGGNAKDLYEIDVMRCKNQGSDYEDENVQWTCTASLPSEFKLGSTDVICEGYESSEDPYVLKGSCGVEYRLLLTDIGEEKYGRGSDDLWGGFQDRKNVNWSAIIFWGLFIGVLGWMAYSAYNNRQRRAGALGGNAPWGWGGGGGGGPGGDDPPPPYDYPSYSKPRSSTSNRPVNGAAQQGWRPGFWTGTAAGAAGAYIAGNRGQTQQPRNQGFWGNNNNGEGSSSWGGGGQTRTSRSSSSSFGSARHESSGFGSTSRR